MIAVLLTPTDSLIELRLELKRWKKLYNGIPPLAIVGHKDLAYALINAPEFKAKRGGNFFDNVAVITLSDLWTLHSAQLGEEALDEAPTGT